jgi:hypothetical protein
VTYTVIPVDGAVIVNGIPSVAGDIEKITGETDSAEDIDRQDDVRVVLNEDNLGRDDDLTELTDGIFGTE